MHDLKRLLRASTPASCRFDIDQAAQRAQELRRERLLRRLTGGLGVVVILGVAASVVPVRQGVNKNAVPPISDATPSQSPQTPEESKEQYVGFYPESQTEEGMVVMPLTFLDGSSAEVVASRALGIQDMSATVYTSGGLGGVDRTMDFRYRDGGTFMHEGPLETYEGANGTQVELWDPAPDTPAGCPNLVFRFDKWFASVRTCQDELSESEKETWAQLLKGEVTEEGFLVLSSSGALQLQETGGHEGPQMYLGMDRANWIQLLPGQCDPKNYATGGDVQTMSDGTQVTFSQLEDGNSKIEYDWSVSWCEDGLVRVQVEYAYEGFAKAAAEGFRLENISLAD